MARCTVVLLFLLLSVFDQTYSFLFRSHKTSIWPTNIRLLATTHTTSKGGGGSGIGSKNKPNKKIKKKKPKRKQRFGTTSRSNEPSFYKSGERTGTSPNTEGADRNDPLSRSFLVDYDSNRNPRINKFRLLDGRVRCPHYPNCPSCVITERVGDIPIIESAKQYFSSANVRRRRRDILEGNLECEVDSSDDGFYEVVVPSDLEGWRSQAKLVVQPSTSRSGRAEHGCDFGLYQKGTHRVVPIPNCAAHHPSINKAVAALTDATRNMRTVAYQEKFRAGDLRYAQFRVERSTGKICLTLVWNSENLKGTQPHLSRLVKELTKENNNEYLWHSIWCHCNDSKSNAIFNLNPDRWYRLMGPEYMREPLSSGKRDENGGWLYFTPQTFRQGNMEGFDVLAKDVAHAIPGGSKVCELYAGVGVLGLTALQYHHDSDTGLDSSSLKWIRCSDENPTNLKCFARAVRSLDPDITCSSSTTTSSISSNVESKEISEAEFTRLLHSGETKIEQVQSSKPQDKTSYIVASAAKALKSGQALGANILLVDPPRKGLDLEVLDELCKPVNPNQPYVELSDLLPLEGSTLFWANDVKLLIYVSCGFKALARDCECLLSSGNWILESATGYILFPGSDHVETLCVFTRSG